MGGCHGWPSGYCKIGNTKAGDDKLEFDSQLGLQGEEIGEGTQTDPELLMTIMEARESIENTKDIAELQQFAKVFQRQQETCIQVCIPEF